MKRQASVGILYLIVIVGFSVLSYIVWHMDNSYSPMDSYIKAINQRYQDSITYRVAAQHFIDSINHK